MLAATFNEPIKQEHRRWTLDLAAGFLSFDDKCSNKSLPPAGLHIGFSHTCPFKCHIALCANRLCSREFAFEIETFWMVFRIGLKSTRKLKHFYSFRREEKRNDKGEDQDCLMETRSLQVIVTPKMRFFGESHIFSVPKSLRRLSRRSLYCHCRFKFQ